ncbi:MAG: hypothetical protein IJM30_04145 [Thermoguttaceae bacterium]|nr:hypothetical protein [Thermoguttaceae bacterium]
MNSRILLASLLVFSLAAPVCESLNGAEKREKPAIDARRDPSDDDVVFQLGVPDARSCEFRLGLEDWRKAREEKGEVVWRQIIGETPDKLWPARHFSTAEYGNLGYRYALEIQFESAKDYDSPLYLVVGIDFSHWDSPSLICVKTNGVESAKVRQPIVRIDQPGQLNMEDGVGKFESVLIEVPAGTVKKGTNVVQIALEDGSWLYYDYVALRERKAPLKQLDPPPPPELWKDFKEDGMKGVDEIVFAVRKPSIDGHWYANFGYYMAATDPNDRPFRPHGGGSLRALDLRTKKVRTILNDPNGSVRDPVVSYDAKKILFSYLRSGTEHYNLYEINVDGTGLRQITSGDYDDIEACYLPDGDVVFCSSRADRCVQCWLVSVATVWRCGPNGENPHMLSPNVEQDNEPWVLNNGQIVYTRWEYVDREQLAYHHLWTMAQDGARQNVLFGNQFEHMLFIGAKPIPGSDKIVATIAPGHGMREHYGRVAIIDPTIGPDDFSAATYVSKSESHSDPWAFSETEFMAAKKSALVLLDETGTEEVVYELPQEEKNQDYWIQEPRPLIEREREPILASSVDLSKTTGTLVLSDIYAGRRMKDVPRGTVKELLVLETLPEPIHYSGGMDMASYKGTFTLERILGTVPVTPEGAAAIELPANRSVLFVALDAEGKAVKRMHSFTSVAPGEQTSCIGCHETRTEAPGIEFDKNVFAIAGKPVAPTPVEGVPEVFDFTRDIQPLFDKYCVECHNPDRTDGGVDLTGDFTPLYCRSYWEISRRAMLGDNRNRHKSDFEPYQIGSGASSLYQMICDGHQGVSFSDDEKRLVRFWLETGAPYAGTYAANGTGLIGWFYRNVNVHDDKDWPETVAMKKAIERRCDSCHDPKNVEKNLPHALSEDREDVHQYERYIKRVDYYNLSRPEKSKILRAPLAADKGGLGKCVETTESGDARPVFANVDDPDYQTILAGIERGKKYVTEERPAWSVRPFVANPAYVQMMKKYGVLPEEFDEKTPIDPYEIDRKYWDKFDLSKQKR